MTSDQAPDPAPPTGEVPASPLPAGRYFSLTTRSNPEAGGQTRAVLLRNRLFAAAGVDARVLTVLPRRDLDHRREVLLERGLITPEVPTLNLYEHYRDTDWPTDEVTDERLPDLGHLEVVQETLLVDGSPWRLRYLQPDGTEIYDYQRPDGSVFLRTPGFLIGDRATWPTRMTRVSRDGAVMGHFAKPAGWIRRWVRELSEGERTFIVLDSRSMVPLVPRFDAPHLHVLYLMHNVHVYKPYRWDSTRPPSYDALFERADDLDALVTLTDRQRQDIATLRGRTTNMYVVPNPVDLPEVREVQERDPRKITVVARLEPQKRLTHAVLAMKRVLERVPDATLHIYGDGSREEVLRRLVEKHDLGRSVVMHGYDAHAREALWDSSAMLLTSVFEGYPLATLEAMSHGCPVVAYDIKYGPREQITDGEDGFLVPAGDLDTMADRLVTLLQDPERVARMGLAARRKAEQHGQDAFVRTWAEVFEQVARTRPGRTRLDEVRLEVRRLRVGRSGSWSSRLRPGQRLRLSATLHVDGTSATLPLSDAEVTLVAVHERSGRQVDLPVGVSWRGDRCRVRCTARIGDVVLPHEQAGRDATGEPTPAADGPEHVRLWLRLVWANSVWSTEVRRPAGAASGLEVGYGPDEQLVLTRR
ncbi:poly(glycerol-phosphate) alpha-glucosyltransferase [Nocardioides scoriae]|uniref:Poly(Glycerol-phosphate) alpha-glucosyltransferase n=1 Tax=Nocardioides scoriae TaxID=642780 RepID=A0A1H1TYX3_9ACTN|nr:glycosyltransferase [Nocardioides scoriae]SDS65351.1 poly(glycerol-phosphate) alpha-glucosyltransferase [Nocardioides scoriae]